MNTKRNSKRTPRVKAVALAVAACFAALPVFGAPSTPTVVSGSATFSTSGSTLTITNTPKAIINWQSFSIDPGETVRFVQQSATSSVLNRVTGADPSHILGALQSNGKVFLVNPNGIIFGANARIDVNGLVASTLNITDSDFLNGRLRFAADRVNPGSITNAGEISTPNGGFVYLLAPNVENSGVITTPSGEAILAAGHSIEIVDSADPSQRVQVSATVADVNLSQLMTQSGGNIFAVLNSGRVSANTAVQDATGKIYFKSAGNITTTSTSVVEARGDVASDGGSFIGYADHNGVYAGSFDVSGRNGGFIETSGRWIDVNSAQINMRALGPNGKGGTWLLDPYDIVICNYGCDDNQNYIYDEDENGGTFSGYGGTTALIFDSAINSALNWGNVTITTTGNGNGYGDITLTFDAMINSANGHTLLLQAGRDIHLYGGISTDELFVYAGGQINVSGATISATDIIFGAQGGINITNSYVGAVDFLGIYAIDASSGNAITAYLDSIAGRPPTYTDVLNVFNRLQSQSDVVISDFSYVDADVLHIMGNNVRIDHASASGYETAFIMAREDIALSYGGLSAGTEMLAVAGRSIRLENESYISVGSNNTLYFGFPLLSSGGWYVDGVQGSFGACTYGASCITVDGGVPIPGFNFFVIYGGGLLIQVLGPMYENGMSSFLYDKSLYETRSPSGEEFFGQDEDEEDQENNQPQQCSA
ncbi:MAG: filamentous hemagglutinin N-terminal domain-containing protein [Methylophilaceae bacterium]|nr:filamentous hemagglutinin N-terminal domain-containing protein [Methylophilaceae bacterium]